MKASILVLRYKMKEILKALEGNEQIHFVYHGKLKGILTPAGSKAKLKVKDHEFFGFKGNSDDSVEAEMDSLRGGRYRAI